MPMNCPKCHGVSKVTNSRLITEGRRTYRRRHCPECGHDFTTYEEIKPDNQEFKAAAITDTERLEWALENMVLASSDPVEDDSDRRMNREQIDTALPKRQHDPKPKKRILCMAVTMADDGSCNCGQGDKCPLGKTGAASRCTEQELIERGFEVI